MIHIISLDEAKLFLTCVAYTFRSRDAKRAGYIRFANPRPSTLEKFDAETERLKSKHRELASTLEVEADVFIDTDETLSLLLNEDLRDKLRVSRNKLSMKALQEDRRKDARRQESRRKQMDARKVELIKELRMQARVRAAANRSCKVEPSEPERFSEWRAADVLESEQFDT